MTIANVDQVTYTVEHRSETGWNPVFYCGMSPRYFRAFLSYMKRECDSGRSEYSFENLRVQKALQTVYPSWEFDGRVLKEL